MDNLIIILFICIAMPLAFSLLLVNSKSRVIILFLIIGTFICLFISAINGLIKENSKQSLFYLTTTITPITEELIKALPIVVFGFCISSKRETLISISIAEGIGFAILENAYILINSIGSISLTWALSRVIGASLMHGICTALVGLGVSFVRIKKKFFVCGTFALLITAITYHGIFNLLVQSDMQIWAYLLPIITYIPIVIYMIKNQLSIKASNKNQE